MQSRRLLPVRKCAVSFSSAIQTPINYADESTIPNTDEVYKLYVEKVNADKVGLFLYLADKYCSLTNLPIIVV